MATEYLTSFMPSTFFFQHFERKTQLLSYLILCVSKMPFVPPVSIARSHSVSVSGLTGKERRVNNTSSTATLARAKAQIEDTGSLVKERLALNLKQLGKKPRSHLPTAKGVSWAGLHVKGRGQLLPSSNTFPASNSGESIFKMRQHDHGNHKSVKSEPEVKTRARHQEEARFTLTLTPEAVLLLQRRSNERHQRLAGRNAGGGTGTSNTTDSRRRRENISKRHQPATRHIAASSRVTSKNSNNEPGDISSLVKISLLNEQHKYDDVEYEEEDCGVDERVVLKCTEWLRGLENTPVTVGNSSLKGF
ncbi:uncharacterized protein ACN63O_010308 [Diretmus argenteus]